MAMMIDLNCDLGEGYGRWTPGVDAAVMPSITSANIACGAHAGDPAVMRATVELARQHQVGIGAHPSYPDLQGFGRREMALSPSEVYETVLYQIGSLYAFTRAAGVDLTHVKPHGALYNHAGRDMPTADAIARAVAAFSRELILVGLANSALINAGLEQGLPVAREAFADRAYEADGSLRSRTFSDAVFHDTEQIVAQAIAIARDQQATTVDGTTLTVTADTLCLHGDTHAAATLAQAIRTGLERAGVAIRPLREIVAVR